MTTLFGVFAKKPQAQTPIIIVSGLPRSGTSMMMKILAEGGIPIITDELRRADADNPDGYFELETVKQLSLGNADWLAKAGGKGVKVISTLLEYLPAHYKYKVIFMERELREILASQHKMLRRRNEESKIDDADMEAQFRRHVSVVKSWLARQPNMDVLYLSYNALMNDPEPLCRRVVEFTGAPLNLSRMLAVPNAELYRNRVSGL